MGEACASLYFGIHVGDKQSNEAYRILNELWNSNKLQGKDELQVDINYSSMDMVLGVPIKTNISFIGSFKHYQLISAMSNYERLKEKLFKDYDFDWGHPVYKLMKKKTPSIIVLAYDS